MAAPPAFNLPARPPLALRVGVTGHRSLPPGDDRLRAAVAAILALARRTVQQIAADPAARAVHAPGAAPLLRLISPLAAGADTLVAEEALRQGWRLEAALPFPPADYEADFDAAALAGLRGLLDRARDDDGVPQVTSLDGSRDAGARARSYAAAGRLVVRNCDLLIALWDRRHPARRGGTEDTVRAAVAASVPVWRIDPACPEEAGLFELDGDSGDPAGSEAALVRALRLALLPPEAPSPHAHGLLQVAAGRVAGHRPGRPGPLLDYLREAAPGRPRLRRAYAVFMRAATSEAAPPLPRAAPSSRLAAWWDRHHAAAAGLSRLYGDRHRSSYVLVFILAGLALLAAILSFVVPHHLHLPVAVVELGALSGIALLVTANHAGRWQERWIAYRLLAELCRAQGILAPLGWTLPVQDVARLLTAHPAGPLPPREAWVAWYFAALRRGAPLPPGTLQGATLVAARDDARQVFALQRDYHRLRWHRSQAASRRLARWGESFFLFALVGVAARIVLEVAHSPPGLVFVIGLACALSPAVSATLLGIRAYAEFELLARQSDRMARIMQTAIDDIDAPLDGTLASEALGTALLGVSTAMLLDIDGWAQLFHVKALEAG